MTFSYVFISIEVLPHKKVIFGRLPELTLSTNKAVNVAPPPFPSPLDIGYRWMGVGDEKTDN